MNEQVPANYESDPRFPSGEWTGFYLQYWMPGRHKTEVDLFWKDGIVTGDGYDRVGPYTINGTYDTTTGKCEWTKQYTGKHAVAYRGVNNGQGISGIWEIRQLGGMYVDRGGFHLWPEGSDVSEESDRTEKAVLAAMEKEFAGRTSPLRPPARNLARIVFSALLTLVLAAYLWWRFAS
jgi:hypothetical protein